MSSHIVFHNPTEMLKALAGNINYLRNKEEWTIQDLATFADVSVETLTSIESGERIPVLHTLTRIAEALEMPLYRLFVPDQRMLDPGWDGLW